MLVALLGAANCIKSVFDPSLTLDVVAYVWKWYRQHPTVSPPEFVSKSDSSGICTLMQILANECYYRAGDESVMPEIVLTTPNVISAQKIDPSTAYHRLKQSLRSDR